MKPPVSPHMVAILLFGTMAPLCAQNVPGASRSLEATAKTSLDAFSEREFIAASTGQYEMPVRAKAKNEPSSSKPVFASQDALTLDTRYASEQKVESVVDLDVLRNPSLYKRVLVNADSQPDETGASSLQNGLALISAVYRETGTAAEASDCGALSLSVEQRVKLDVSKVLEVVESEIAANPSCSCEVVKAAIKASEASVETVVSIVETAINASPENMRIISQCAIAAMPESIAEVQALLTRLDPNAGEDAYSSKSAKSAKSAKVAAIAVAPEINGNPLDLPPAYPPIIPPIFPHPVTKVNP